MQSLSRYRVLRSSLCRLSNSSSKSVHAYLKCSDYNKKISGETKICQTSIAFTSEQLFSETSTSNRWPYIHFWSFSTIPLTLGVEEFQKFQLPLHSNIAPVPQWLLRVFSLQQSENGSIPDSGGPPRLAISKLHRAPLSQAP